MNELPQLPSMETIKQRAAKMEEICRRADAGILLLDDLIAQLEQEIRASRLYQLRLKRARQLCDRPINN
uniref:Uncharacterized protein n=1 Tax=Cyanothece sp. (strain PCC 7425 / ATCC 29141) TaxID=395961 RepID=B8HKI8_CYAP4